MMNLGIMLDTLIAASFTGKFAPNLNIPKRSNYCHNNWWFNARLWCAFSIWLNIEAYFSGIASGSLHGWLWLVFAFIENAIRLKLHPLFFSK